MDALPFNRIPGEQPPVDWVRRLFVCGYMGGIAVFLFLAYYKPDTSLETWAWREAEKRMRARGCDMHWLDVK
jgi:hypothetical protein